MRKWVALWVLAGCGGDAPEEYEGGSALEGTYEVDSYALDDVSCDGPGTDATAPYAFFEVAIESFFGVEALTLSPCEAPGTCDDSLFSGVYFEVFDDDSASGTTTMTSYSGGYCSLTWIESTLALNGAQITFETRTYEVNELEGSDLDDCTAQQESWSGPRDCVELQTLTGAAAR